jgi:hypothetical protein
VSVRLLLCLYGLVIETLLLVVLIIFVYLMENIVTVGAVQDGLLLHTNLTVFTTKN